ncbi:MAG: response regulator [Leptospirales bacterium]
MGTNKKILVVDDSMIARMFIVRHIDELYKNWTILEAAGAEAALKILEESSVDVISIDYNMPGLNGLELAKKIQELYSSVKIALLTANIQDTIRKEAEDIGLVFLEKPITAEIVKKLVEL